MASRRARPRHVRRSTATTSMPDTSRRRTLAGPTPDGILRIGYVAGSHGLHGALRVRTDDPGSTTLSTLKRLFVETADGRREFKVLDASPLSAGNHRVMLEGIGDADAAEALCRGAVMVAAADLPPLGEGEF